MDLNSILSQGIAYLGYCLALAGALQLGINQIKPKLIDPWRVKFSTEESWLTFIYIIRTVITTIAYLFVWGGVEATRATVPGLPTNIPDFGVGLITVGLVVLGQEVLHPLIEQLYLLKDTLGIIKVDKVETTEVTPSGALATTTTTTTATSKDVISTPLADIVDKNDIIAAHG